MGAVNIQVKQEPRPWWAWLSENYTPIMISSGIVMFIIGVVLLLGWAGFFMVAGVIAVILGLLSN